MNVIGALALAAATTVPGTPTDVAIETYLDGLQQPDPAVAQALAEPDTPAWWYATYESLYTSAILDAGREVEQQTVTVDDGTAEACYEDESLPCSHLDGFTATPDGLIVTFDVDGNDIGPRLGVASEQAIVGSSATASVLVSYRTVSTDALIVLVGLDATTTTDIGYTAGYVNPDGRQVESSEEIGPDEVFGGAHATVALSFAASDPGGRLIWSASSADDDFLDYELAVPALIDTEGTATTT
jgi:hypothetical protein